MHSHIAILDSKNRPLTLQPDTSINITDKNPMFNDVEMFSQPIPLPFEQNRHLLGNMDDVNSSTRANDIRGERFRILVDGLPLRNTAIKVQEGTLLKDSIEVNFDAANRTFKEMIQNMRCRDVVIDDDIKIGEKIDKVMLSGTIDEKYHVYTCHADTRVGWSHIYITGKKTDIGQAMFSPTATDYSFPARCEGSFLYPDQDNTKEVSGKTLKVPKIRESYINTHYPYGDKTNSPHKDKNGATIGWPYCNSRICYAHHDVEYETENGQKTPKVENDSYITSSDIVQSEKANPSNGYDYSPYWLLPADRPASGLCFYVAYFMEKLFKTLGVAYDMSALLNITDFNYLCFFSTACHYVTKDKKQSEGKNLRNEEEINEWLENRGLGGRISVDYDKTVHNLEEINIAAGDWTSLTYSDNVPDRYKPTMDPATDGFYASKQKSYSPNFAAKIWADQYSTLERYFEASYSISAEVVDMFATSDNFPDVNVSEVIESLENSFGVRFCYDAEANKVTARLLRDMFRQQDSNGDPLPVVPFHGTVLSMNKMIEKAKGIRMKYAAESDSREQQDNIRYNKYDYDTTYNYIEYPENRTEFKSYSEVVNLIDIGNRRVYIDLSTGDAFRIKVSSEASTVTELKPSAFEVGGLHGVEIGDCSKEAEDEGLVKEFVSNFEPVITNILRDKEGKKLYVPFIDEDMEHEFVTKKIQNGFSISSNGEDYINLNYVLNSLEAYDPSSTDDGQSPLQEHDWGLTIGILRPMKNGGGVFQYDRGYDGFDNSRWGYASSDFAITSDSYDVEGNFLGTNPAGSFSLKPRAYKPFRYYFEGKQLHISTNPKEWDDAKWLIPCNNDIRNADGTIAARILSRGMCETWMTEFFHFLLNAQLYEVKALCTAAELADIPNKWLRRWKIDGKIGYLNLLEYPVDMTKGIGEVKIEFFAI